MSQVAQPALKYFGGKWALAPWITENFPPHRVYVEPFGNGGLGAFAPRAQVNGE